MGQWMPFLSMRDHPIPAVTEPLQYMAIGVVRGTYRPEDPEQFTRGFLVDSEGVEIEAVVLGRVLTLMRRHLVMDQPHLWVVYPRCREQDHLHLQIAGIWEPSTLKQALSDESESDSQCENSLTIEDQLPEGDDYFSIRGELIYTRPETGDLVLKIRQQPRGDGNRPVPFKLQIKGDVPLTHLRHFVSLDVRRRAQQLHLEGYEVMGPMPTRGGKGRGGRGALIRRDGRGSKTNSNPNPKSNS